MNAPSLPAPLRWLDETPFFQAGLQGYSDAAMRIVARRRGAPYCVTESLLDDVLLRGGRGLEAARLDPEDHPIAGQIIGTDPGQMARAARVLLALGYDVVDVNLACPVKKMRGLCRGGHLLTRPDIACDILRAVREAAADSAPVTVKLRRGYDDSAESIASFHRILEAAIGLGFAAATIHGRTVEQKYVGPSRWSFLTGLTGRYPGFTVLGSGDILTSGSIFGMIAATGVRGVSVARGAIGNPWIFRQAREILRGDEPRQPSLEEQGQALEEHYRLAARFHGEGDAGRSLRKIGIKMSRLHPRAEDVARAFIAARDNAGVLGVIARHYGDAAGAQPCPTAPLCAQLS